MHRLVDSTLKKIQLDKSKQPKVVEQVENTATTCKTEQPRVVNQLQSCSLDVKYLMIARPSRNRLVLTY